MTFETNRVLVGDVLDMLATLPDESIDAVCTDPPYGIGFLGHEWDQPDAFGARSADHGGSTVSFDGPAHPAMEAGRYDRSLDAQRTFQRWCEAWGAELLRVAKPGAHLLAFGAPRAIHRMTAGLEDAGWEIRDQLVWGHAEGMPKDGNAALRIDRMLCPMPSGHRSPKSRLREGEHHCPRTEEGLVWDDWSTTLKPAWEPIVLARKPMTLTIAANLTTYGTGALNIGATRIPVPDGDPINEATFTVAPSAIREGTAGFLSSNETGDRIATKPRDGGRWPADLILTDPLLDGDYPEVVGGGRAAGSQPYDWSRNAGDASFKTGLGQSLAYLDDGTYSRFFLVPKATRGDREPLAVADLPEVEGPNVTNTPPATLRRCRNCGSSRLGDSGVHHCRPDCPGKDLEYVPAKAVPRRNTHPTVKPSELMRHLVRLVTPPGGVVLDPFMGSGTTAVAAEAEGFQWLGIERDEQYARMTRARLVGRARGLGL